jgi:hypothetical protein
MDLLPDSPEARAIAHVQGLSKGGPIDSAHRVTINFHPDRLHRDLPILRAMARDGVRSSRPRRASPDYRGPEYVELGRSLAEDSVLTPKILGDAARTRRHDAQDLKKVWHYLARFGA